MTELLNENGMLFCRLIENIWRVRSIRRRRQLRRLVQQPVHLVEVDRTSWDVNYVTLHVLGLMHTLPMYEELNIRR